MGGGEDVRNGGRELYMDAGRRVGVGGVGGLVMCVGEMSGCCGVVENRDEVLIGGLGVAVELLGIELVNADVGCITF